MEFHLGNPPCTHTFRGTITLTCGDNLASYFVGGYKQLSSAFRKCRFCLAVFTDMQEKVHLCVQSSVYKYDVYPCSFVQQNFYHVQERHTNSILMLWTWTHGNNIWATIWLYFEFIILLPCHYRFASRHYAWYPGGELATRSEGASKLSHTREVFFLLGSTQKIERFPYMQTDKANKPVSILTASLTSSDHSLKQKGRYIILVLNNMHVS